MKYLVYSFLMFSFFCSCKNSPNESTKGDLKKLSWIEGNWKGMDGQNPFYEIYELTNDNELVIKSYEWNGKDSSKTTITHLRRENGNYYLGDERNWLVMDISDSSIIMEPVNKVSNNIIWKQKDQNSWEAILETKKVKKVYLMERINHFE